VREPLAILRCDASPDLGTGHVMRCLVFARALTAHGWKTLFVCRPPSRTTVPGLAAAALHELPSDLDLAEEATYLRHHLPAPALLVVDHYGWHASLEEGCRGWCRRILVVDDTAASRRDADFLVNPNPGWSEKAYHGLLPRRCRLLLGPRYAFLHPAFRSARAIARPRREVRRILVAMGGTDPVDATGEAVAVLAAADFPGTIEVVLGPAAPGLPSLRRRVAGDPRFHLRVGVTPPEMAELLRRCDLAVAAAGSSSWERCCVGLPSIVSPIVANQERAARALEAEGIALVVEGLGRGGGGPGLASALERLRSDPGLRAQFRERGRRLVDGRGAERVTEAVARTEAVSHAP